MEQYYIYIDVPDTIFIIHKLQHDMSKILNNIISLDLLEKKILGGLRGDEWSNLNHGLQWC